MMVAMMLPPVLPWILFFASAERDHRPSSPPFASASALVGGYFTIWGGFSVAAALGQLGLERLTLLRSGTLSLSSEVGATLLLVAGLFQFTALKAACLTHCRSPLGFYLSHWRNGPVGAYRMGFRHGLYCLGCCWALMGLAFAFGVMNLLWMAALTLVICLEQIAAHGKSWSRAFGTMFIGWGLAILVW
jgi:predicted metal-binding membrane protein